MKRSAPLRRKTALRRHNPPVTGKIIIAWNVRGLPMVKDYKKRLDALCREVVMLRDGAKCQWCGKTDNLQWCHIKSRRYLSTRWRLENSLILDAGCHLLAHHNPLDFAAWFSHNYPERANLLRLSSRGGKVDAHGTWLWLMQERKRLEGAA